MEPTQKADWEMHALITRVAPNDRDCVVNVDENPVNAGRLRVTGRSKSMDTSQASKVLYIKLGRKGSKEKGCIEGGVVWVSFRGISHELCVRGDWETVWTHLKEGKNGRRPLSPGAATDHTRQLRLFYEAGKDVLWITFHEHALWWCFSSPEIEPQEDGSRVRPVIGRWSNLDATQKPLLMQSLRGTLLKIQGYQGTICEVHPPVSDCVKMRIRGEEPQDVRAARDALAKLKRNIRDLVEQLYWGDFEVLVDLIFRQAGWQRVGVLGRTEKTWDLDVLSPATNEKGVIQVKSVSTASELREHYEKFKAMPGYRRMFYVVHTPDSTLKDAVVEDDRVTVLLGDRVAELAINSGLAEWVIAKSS